MNFETTTFRFEDLTVNFDKRRIPLSSGQRENRQGQYRYYGAQGVIDYVDDYIFDGKYLLIAEDGENLKSKKQDIAQIVEGKFWVNNHAHVVQGNALCLTEYLCYLLNHNDLSGYITGSAQPKLSQANLNAIAFDVPSIETQQIIVSIISALDEKIATNREINDNLQQQAASIFVEWLNTCTDFSTIGDMAHNILDYSPVGSEQIRLLNSSDVTEGVFPIAPLVPNKDLKGHFKKRFKFGDILYSEIRPRNHHYGFVLFDTSDYIASTRLMVIRAIENKVSPAMLYQYLLLPEVEAEFTLKTESRSGTFPQGNYADMASIQVPYSPTNSQTAVSEILSRIRFAIAQNQFESQRLAELRDALLPKLMSGEIDISAVQL